MRFQYCRARFLSVVVSFAFASGAFADMGRAPVGSLGFYGSIEGGYLFQDGNDVTGHAVAGPSGVLSDVRVSPENGFFAGGMAGFASGVPLVTGLPFTRFEGYLLYGKLDDSTSDSVPPLTDIAFTSVDGLVNIAGGTKGKTSVERETWESGSRMEVDQQTGANSSLTYVFGTFFRRSEEDTETTVSDCCVLHREGEVDTSMYGILTAVEPEIGITPFIALVGRVGVGVYGYDVDGDFRSFATGLPPPDPVLASLSDSKSGVGFRGLLGAALKIRLAAGANLEAFAEADYFSDVGTADFTTSTDASGTASSVDTSDLWELRTGARLTIGFGAAN